MSKHTKNRTLGDRDEIMKGKDGRGQNTAGDREIMKGKDRRGQNTADQSEIMEPGSSKRAN
jgi:hypothetical protein